MNKTRFLTQYSICFLITLLLAGCDIFETTSNDIVGQWVEHSTSIEFPQQCGFFEFFEDGKFEARNVPSKYFISFDYLPERFDGNGEWELEVNSKNPFEVQQIILKFAPTEAFPLGFDSNLYISVGGKTLFGGIDDNVLFSKDETCKQKDSF